MASTMRRKQPKGGVRVKKEVRFSAPHPLKMFPLAKDVNLTDVWCGKKEEARATWLDWDDDGGTVRTDLSGSAGLDTSSALFRDFRRFESGGLFTTLGQEKEAARRACRAFSMTPVSGLKQLNQEFVIVPKDELRELASLEGNLRAERSRFVDDCEDVIARARMIGCERYPLSEPSAVATFVLVAACDEEIRRCEATVKAMVAARESEAMRERAVRPWRRGLSRVGKVSGRLASLDRPQGLSGRLRPETDLNMARLAVQTGSWGAFRERQRWHARMAETELMAFEDGYCACAWRAATARETRLDYELYVSLVAKYGIPFDEDQFGSLGAAAGATFLALVHRGAVAWQRMWWYYAPTYRLRRDRGSTLFQTRWRSYYVRKRWVPILHLRTACGKMRPMSVALSHWHKVIIRTVRARRLVHRVKYGGVKRVLKAWRGLVGDDKADQAVDALVALFADDYIHEDVAICSHEYESNSELRVDNFATRGVLNAVDGVVASEVERVIADFCANLPTWMDANWFLQKTGYDSHVRLADAGVLPKSLFEDSHREQMHNRTATKIQRVARGVFGRDVVRDKFARVIRKRYDIQKGFFYTNIVTKKTFDARPLLIPRLFPNSNF